MDIPIESLNEENIQDQLANTEDLLKFTIQCQLAYFDKHNAPLEQEKRHPFGTVRRFGDDKVRRISSADINMGEGQYDSTIYELSKTSETGARLFAIFHGRHRGIMINRLPEHSALIWKALHTGELKLIGEARAIDQLQLGEVQMNGMIPVQDILHARDRIRIYTNNDTVESTVVSQFSGITYTSLYYLISILNGFPINDSTDVQAFIKDRKVEQDYKGFYANNITDRLIALIQQIDSLRSRTQRALKQLELIHIDTGNYSDWVMKYIKKDNLINHLTYGHINNVPNDIVEFTPWTMLQNPSEYIAIPYLIDFDEIDFEEQAMGKIMLAGYEQAIEKRKQGS